MITRLPIVALTLRALLDRKRTWLMVLLAAMPVGLVLLATSVSSNRIEGEDLDIMIVSIVLPLVALVFGTSALGPELEEGTIVYLLTKPIRRFRVVLDKSFVAAVLTAALVVPSALLTGLVAEMGGNELLQVSAAFGVGCVAGGAAYVVLFVAISAFTRWALIIGLLYVLIWEGVLADLLPGTETFSIRQATLAISWGISGERVPFDVGSLDQGLITIGLVLVVGIAVATWRMSRYQLRGGD
jgi:ABC-2 type transport system permease protein